MKQAKNIKGNTMIDLHVHTKYSLLDAIIEPEELVLNAVKQGKKAVCATEHGNVISSIELYKLCKKHDIKYIYGCEFYICNDVHVKDSKNRYHHLIVLAKNEVGRKNINKLVSLSTQYEYYKKPRIDWKLLKQYKAGLIVMTACMAGEIPKLLMGRLQAKDMIEEDTQALDMLPLAQKQNGFELAKIVANRYKQEFGEDFYIEIQAHDVSEQLSLNKKLVQLAKELDIEFVVTTDAHYLNKEDQKYHSVWVQIGTTREVGEIYNDCYIMPDKIIENTLIKTISQEDAIKAMNNTHVIADKCNVELPLRDPKLPHTEIPSTFKSELEYIQYLCVEGWIKKRISQKSKEEQEKYKKRLRYELDVLEKMGYLGYFLIVQDYKSQVYEVGISRGCFRGNAIVTTQQGNKKLKDVAVGDKVITADKSFNTVLATHSYDIQEDLVSITTQDSLGNQLNAQATFDHKIAVYKGDAPKWVQAINVEVGDMLYSPIGEIIKVVDKDIVENVSTTVYDLTIDNFANYVLNGFTVHNSAGGSLVAYLMDITDLDPIAHDLYFERFLDVSALDLLEKGIITKKELKIPDIDLDFSKRKRENVMDYVISAHGRENVCALGTFNYVWGKGAIRDIGKVLGIPHKETDKMAKKIDGSMDFKDVMELGVLDEFQNEYPELFEYANRLSGLPKAFSSHACFTAGNQVLTDMGYKDIENIAIGDMVFTHKNRFQPVVNTTKHEAKSIYSYSTIINKATLVTPNHPILIKQQLGNGQYSPQKWQAVEDMKIGDLVGVPIIKTEIDFQHKELPTNKKDFWWTLGLYFSGGWINQTRQGTKVYIQCNKLDVKDLLTRTKNILGKPNKQLQKGDTVTLIYTQVQSSMVTIFEDIGCFRGEKHIPPYIYYAFKDAISSFIDGILFLKKSNKLLVTQNKSTVYGLFQCVAKVYNTPIKVTLSDSVNSLNKYYKCTIPSLKDNPTWKYDREFNYLWVKVEDIHKTNTTDNVYNLTVLDDSSYTVNGVSVHNCGIVLSNEPITDMGAVDMKESMPVLMHDMHDAEDLGMVKFDFLGLKTVDVIYDTLELIGETDELIAPHNIDWNDKAVWREFAKGNTALIFQFSSPGMRQVLQSMQAESIHDLTVANALYRPGSLAFIDDYVKRKNGLEKPVYLHPDLESVLKSTYGIIVFQEQLIEIGKLAKLANPDILRKATGKKDVELMAKVKPELTQGLQRRGWTTEQVNELWDIMIEFSKYSFNKSHSAGYSVLAYQTMFLKVHYPKEFLLASIYSEEGKIDELIDCYMEAKRLGIDIVKPTWRNISGHSKLV